MNPKSRPSKQIPTRMPADLYEAAEAGAKERGMSISAYVREAVRNKVGEDQRRYEAESLEARLVASIQRVQKDVRIVRGDLHVTMALIDSLVRSFLLHTPPIPPEAVPAASAAADARYERFIKNVVKSVQGHSGVFDQLLGTDPLDVDEEGEPL